MIGNFGGGGGLNRMAEGSIGMQTNRMLDALGLPDNIGDMIGAQIDAANGDWAGYARNMMDLTSGMSSTQMDGVFGRGLPGAHWMPPPSKTLAKGLKLWGQSFATPFGSFQASRQQLGGKGLVGRMVGRSMERAIKRNPAFRAHMEKVLGGRIQLDGRNDGKITVLRFKPRFGRVPFSGAISGNPMMSGLYGALARLEGNIKNLAQSMTKGGATTGSNGVGAQGTTGAQSDAALLSDPETSKLAEGMGMTPPLSFEDMLFLMMMKYARKKEKEILGKMNELSSKDGTQGAQAEQGAGAAGGTGGTANPQAQAQYNAAANKIMSNPNASDTLKQMQMAKLNSDFGQSGVQTQRQPTAAETEAYNKQVDQLVNQGALTPEQGQQAKAQGAFGDPNKTSDALKQMQMQKLMEDLKKMYEMLSNVMKSMHDMQMAAVRNLR
ncbi:MAG: hypothetical protein ABIJ09_17440 [Pseudomonadota bacterium]